MLPSVCSREIILQVSVADLPPRPLVFPFPIPGRWFVHKPNFLPFPFRRGHELPDGFKNSLDLLIIAIICLGAEHGAAKQEILDLKWADIDFDFEGRGRIHFFRTKTERERTEYLMPRTREALLKWRDHLQWMRRRKRVQDKGPGYVFSKLDGRRLDGFSGSWRKARTSAGFPKLHFHDLRHTFCSNLILSGSDLKDVKEMIGHADLSMTDRYAHLTNMRKLARQEDLARFYANSEGDEEVERTTQKPHKRVKTAILDENRVCQHLANIPYSLDLLVGTTGFEPATL